MKTEPMLTRSINAIKTTGSWRLLWLSVLFSEIASTAITSLMSIFLHGRIMRDYLITSGVVALIVSFVVAFILINLLDAVRKKVEEQRTAIGNLLSNSAVATFVINPDHTVVFWNKACEELTGHAAATLINTSDHWKPFYDGRRPTLADVILDGNIGDLPHLYERHARSTLVVNGLHAEGWYKNLNGQERYIIFDAAPVNDSKGKPSLVIETLQDITSQKRTEEALAMSEGRLRAIIDTEPECVKLIARDGTILEMNPAGLAMLEADHPEQILGQSMMPIIVPEHRPGSQALLEKVFQGGSGMLEFEIVASKGTTRWLETHAAPLRNVRGEIYAMLGVTRDVTARKRGEKRLEEQLRFLQLLIDTIPMPVFYKDAHGIYQGCNEAFADFLGQPKEKFIGKSVYDLSPKELADKYHNMDRALLENPGVQVYEYPVKHADGTMHEVIFNKATYTDAEGRVAGLLGVMQDITDRKRLEESLQQTNDTLQALIHASPLAVVVFDEQGTVSLWNPAAERIFGWSKQEVQGRFNPLVTEDKKHEFIGLLDRVLHGERLMDVELNRQRKDGSSVDVSVSSAPLRNAEGGFAGMVSLISDITERRKAEQLIQKNFDIQTAIDWVLHISLQDIPLDSILKQSLDLILSIPWLSFESQGAVFLVDDDPNTLVMKVQRGLSGHIQETCAKVSFGTCLCGRAAAAGEVQFSHTLDDRHEVHYEGMTSHGHYCVPIKQARTVLGVINIYIKEGHQRDRKEIEFLSAIANALAGIVQRKRAEKEREKLIGDLRTVLETVSRSQKEWRDTFDSISDMISIVGKDFTIVKANKAFSAYHGLQPSEVINRKCYELVHDARSPVPNCPHRTTLEEGKVVSEEIFDKKTNRMFSVSTYPYVSPAGEPIGSIHIARDITAEREKEMRLIMSERLASLGQMASGIAHEINNPLAAIAGCAEGLANRVKLDRYDPAFFNNYLNIIGEEVRRCKTITTSMLSFVRKTSYVLKDVDVHETLDKALAIIDMQGRLKKVGVIKRFAGAPPVVRGSENELRQVFLALITNAIDAMDDSGTLTISTGNEAERIVIRVSDTGPGIAGEHVAKIFDPFFTTKSEKGGTGLGLAIARKIIFSHKGSIEVSSEEGKGTTFTLTLPLRDPA